MWTIRHELVLTSDEDGFLLSIFISSSPSRYPTECEKENITVQNSDSHNFDSSQRIENFTLDSECNVFSRIASVSFSWNL